MNSSGQKCAPSSTFDGCGEGRTQTENIHCQATQRAGGKNEGILGSEEEGYRMKQLGNTASSKKCLSALSKLLPWLNAKRSDGFEQSAH